MFNNVFTPKKLFSDYDKKNKFFLWSKRNESWLKTFNKYKYKNIELIITNKLFIIESLKSKSHYKIN